MKKRTLIIIVAVIIFIAIIIGALRFFAPRATCKIIGGDISFGKDNNKIEVCVSKTKFTDAGKTCLSDEDCLSGQCTYSTDYGSEKSCSKTKFLFLIGEIKSTSITYYLLDKPAGSPNFCDGENMDSVGYKNALTQKITRNVQGNLTTEEKIKITLRLAVEDSESFGENYARTANTTFENGIVTMRSADGWAGSSIFYCSWKPFVEKNLEQFSEVKEIKWVSED